MGVSGLLRIRRPPPPSRTSTIPSSPVESHFTPSPLLHTNTIPASSTSSRSVSAQYLPSGPVSPGVEDLHRFPTESLHSFSFTQQSEDFLHSRQNILKKTIDFMRDRLGWAATNPGLADAQARVSGDSDVQSMMQLLRRANLLSVNTKVQGLGLGPITGPADVDGANIFEKSFSQPQPIFEEEAMTQSPVAQVPRATFDEAVANTDLEGRGGVESHRTGFWRSPR